MNKAQLEEALAASYTTPEQTSPLSRDAVDLLGRVIRGHDAYAAARATYVASHENGPHKNLCESFLVAAAHHTDPRVRIAAAQAAGEDISTSTRMKIVAALIHDTDSDVRYFAAESAHKDPKKAANPKL